MNRQAAALRLAPAPVDKVSRNRRVVDPATLGVVDQVRTAFAPKNRLAARLGALFGGAIPFLTFFAAHGGFQAADPWSVRSLMSAVLVCGGLLFSAQTVYDWAKLTFRKGGKALGFVLLFEGTMIGSYALWITIVALVYLICINAIAAGCTLALHRTETP
jgi:hypothetical protein